MIKILMILACIYISQAESFAEFKLAMEMKIINLATEMSNLYANRCDYEVTNCVTKSYLHCEGSDQKINYYDFPKPFACLTEGAYLSQLSAVRIPGSVTRDNLTEQQRRFVCTSAFLEESFHDLNENRNERYGKAYVGSFNGIARVYPTSTPIGCSDYDPRFRPWYIAATSGGKNIILTLDISTSMSRDGLNIALAGCRQVISTLSNNDFIGVVIFSQNASSLVSDRIKRATNDHKQKLLQALDNIKPQGGTNYEDAFIKSFSMLDMAISDEFGSPCEDSSSLILFMTDGYPGVGQISANGILNIISGLNTLDAKIFTYAMGSIVSQALLQAIACANEGIMFVANQNVTSFELTQIMMQYHLYLSTGIYVTKPVWTEPYFDFDGYGLTVTVSMPIYYSESSVRKIVGVAGIDVAMESFYGFGLSTEQQITKELLSNPICQTTTLTDCQLQDMRPYYSKCLPLNCSSNSTLGECFSDTSDFIFTDPVSYQTRLCIGLSIGDIVGIIIGSIIVLHIVGGMIACCYHFKCKKR